MSGPLREPPRSRHEVERALREVQSGRRTAVSADTGDTAAVFRSDADERTLRVHGDIDLAAAESLQAAVLALQRANPAQDIRLDFSDVRFLGACAIDVIVQARQQQRAAGAELVLIGLTRRQRRTFEACAVPTV